MSTNKPPQPAGEMGWDSYVLPVIGALAVSTLSFCMGKWDYGYIWIILIVVFNVLKTYLWKKRELRLLALRATSTREREVIMTQLQDLPAWVQFPDTERVEWMNKVIHQLWPYIGEYSRTFMTDFIVPQVKAQMPAMFKNFKFTKMDMGDIPCRVGGIKVYTTNVGRDRIIVDMDVAYAGDADFSVACCGFSGGMNQIVFSGKLRAVLKPLLPYPPMVGGVSASFLEMPKFDFNLTGMGEMVELPGLMTAIRSVINSQVAAMAVLPNEIVIPLAPDVDVTKLFFPEPDGVIRLKVIEAKNLENRDISFLKKGKSDPYAEIQVGSQFFKTRTIDNDLNPVWNEYFEAVVDQADGQKLRIELFDEDNGQDEELGRLSVDLNAIQARGAVEKWFPLEGCKHGDLHLKATWLDLSTDVKHLEAQAWESEWLKADKPIHPALLMVYIDSISDLPYPKSKLEPSPFVEVTLGKDAQRTPVKVKTVNPLFQSKFQFFVRNPAGQELKFEAFDDGTRRSLGTFTLPLTALMKEPSLEYYQTTFPLSMGVHQSSMVLTVRLRGLRPRQPKPLQSHELEHDTLQHYATGKHIERANGNGAASNGDAVAVEPAKTVNPHHGAMDAEVKLDSSQYHALNRHDSMNSLASGRHSSASHRGTKSRLGRLFKHKHHKSPNDSMSESPRGELELAIHYDQLGQRLQCKCIQARNLRPVETDGTASPYVVVKIITAEGAKEVFKRKTAVYKDNLQPVFDNHFEFDIKPSDLHNYKVQFSVKDDTNYGAFASKPVLGHLELRLDSLREDQLPQRWIELEAERK